MSNNYAQYLLTSAGPALAAALLISNFNRPAPRPDLLNHTAVVKPAQAYIYRQDTNKAPNTADAVQKNVVYHNSAALHLVGAHDITISHKLIAGGDAPCIWLENCYNIHISFNKLWRSKKPGLVIYNCSNIWVGNNFFNDVSTGVYAEKSSMGGIRVEDNEFLNMQGPFPRGQFVQFNNINGPGNSISHNKCENIFGKSDPEDGISLFKSNGTADSPILIKGNWIRGGGPSKSGGGIMLGDNGGSYLMAAENILVNPGQYGIAISGGDHNCIINNKIYARSRSFNNVGLYVAGFGGAKCTNSTVAFNKVYYLNKQNAKNSFWLGPNADKPMKWQTNEWEAPIDSSILPAKIISLK